MAYHPASYITFTSNHFSPNRDQVTNDRLPDRNGEQAMNSEPVYQLDNSEESLANVTHYKNMIYPFFTAIKTNQTTNFNQFSRLAKLP